MEERLYLRSPVFLQNALVSYQGRKLLRERFGSGYAEWDGFLRKSERSAPALIKHYQDERLRFMIAYVHQHVPYYRRVMDERGLEPSDITTAEDLVKLPVLTKTDIRENSEALVSTAMSRRSMRKVYTSGTTGHAVNFFWDRTIEVVNNACLWRARRWAGLRFGDPYATLLGKMVAAPYRKSPPFWRVNRPWNQLFMSPHHLTEENLAHYIGALRDFGAVALDAYPSAAALLARFLERADEYLPLRCVLTTAEPLLEEDRRIIAERFQCDVFDGYSQAERVVYSAECEAHHGHHLFPEYGICEVVDGEGTPVAPGTPGRLVGTGLHNLAMPLIRYDVGDMASLSDEPCPCGRTLPLMGLVATRQGDIITTPDGRLLPPLMVLRPFKYVEGIRASQFVQHSPTDYTVRIVIDRELSAAEKEELVRNLCARLGAVVNIRIERVDDIPKSANQKFRRVLSEVPISWDGGTDFSALASSGGNGETD